MPPEEGRKKDTIKVATIVDGFCKLEDTCDLMKSATHYLRQLEPDVIISNQMHRNWQWGLEVAGFRKTKSNFVMSLSPAMDEKLKAENIDIADIHMNRGDGDGPINL